MRQQHPRPQVVMPSCGVSCIDNGVKFLPIVSFDVHTSIVASSSRTVLKQTFATAGRSLKHVRYTFPLYDGSSVVGFQCTIGSRTIKGVVKERSEAKQAYDTALAQGQTAGLFEQSPEAADVFITSLGNIPSDCQSVDVHVTYLGELKHDAQVDGLRFTIPSSLAQRYGQHSITESDAITFQGGKHMKITVDVDVSSGSVIKSIQSPSHPISVNIGTLSTATSDPPSLQRAHATQAQGSFVLGNDFVLQIVATGLEDPMAVLETHPTIPSQRALMTTLVPRSNLPMEMADVVFMCERSSSMAGANKMGNVTEALNLDAANARQENAKRDEGAEDKDISFDKFAQAQASARGCFPSASGSARKRKSSTLVEADEDQPVREAAMSFRDATPQAMAIHTPQGMPVVETQILQNTQLNGTIMTHHGRRMPLSESAQQQIAAAYQMLQLRQQAFSEAARFDDGQTAALRAAQAAQRAAAAQQAASAQLYWQYQQWLQNQQGRMGRMGMRASASSYGNYPMGAGPAPAPLVYSNPNAFRDSANASPALMLATLQTFAGSWNWGSRLEAVLGVTAQLAADGIQLPGDCGTEQTEVLATLCAVVFLKKKLASEKESWELLVQKAELWLQQQMGADVAEWEKMVEDKLFTN